MFVLCDHLFIMKLHFEEIKLREIELSDAQAIFEYACLDSVCNLTQEEKHNSIDDTYDSIVNYHFQYRKRKAFPTMVIEYQNRVVGLIALHTKIVENVYEIGFELNPKYHNQKIMSEVFEGYLPFMVSKYKIKKIVAEVLKYNLSSIKLLEKFNFKYISENEEALYYERKF